MNVQSIFTADQHVYIRNVRVNTEVSLESLRFSSLNFSREIAVWLVDSWVSKGPTYTLCKLVHIFSWPLAARASM